MILVDTSVWVEHFRKGVPDLGRLLLEDRVLIHPFVIGEIACGNLGQRAEILGRLCQIPAAMVARDMEVLHLIEERHLWGMGIGWIDVHLLASALLTPCGLWTSDRRLHAVAAEVEVAVITPGEARR